MNEVLMDAFIYPCMQYVMQRTGICSTIKELKDAHITKYNDDVKLNIGDIIVWHNPSGPQSYMLSITEKGQVVTTSVVRDRHYGVYEGEGLVSDISFVGNDPYIRITKLGDKRPPIGYIKSNKD